MKSITLRSRMGGNVGVSQIRTTNGYAVVTSWPAGAQDFPDVTRTSDLSELDGIYAAQVAAVKASGYGVD